MDPCESAVADAVTNVLQCTKDGNYHSSACQDLGRALRRATRECSPLPLKPLDPNVQCSDVLAIAKSIERGGNPRAPIKEVRRLFHKQFGGDDDEFDTLVIKCVQYDRLRLETGSPIGETDDRAWLRTAYQSYAYIRTDSPSR